MKTIDLDKLDDLLRSKSYSELTNDELKLITDEIGNEATYHHLQSLVIAASESRHLPVQSSVKKSLMSKMRTNSIFTRLIYYRIPVAMNLIVLVFLAGLYFLIPPKEVIVEKTKLVELPPLIDTVMVQAPADTVYIDKIVKVEIPVYVQGKSEEPDKPKKMKGSSLAESKELQEFLVGTD